MCLDNIDKIAPYERMHIWVLGQDITNSYHLDTIQKEVMMRKLQEIVDEWTKHEVQDESE